MSLVPFNELLARAEREKYAVGYFESWDLDSLLAVADAAEATKSPVILGVSGIYLPDPNRVVKDKLSYYARLGREICESISVPSCFIFNESPYLDWVLEAVNLPYDMVMFTDEQFTAEEQTAAVRQVVEAAHSKGVAVEGELDALPGVGGELTAKPEQIHASDTAQVVRFVEDTGVDALAVNIGQVHLHGRGTAALDLNRLSEMRAALDVPLVLHGASSISREDIQAAIKGGISKVNVGSVLKKTFFETLRRACDAVEPGYNPYLVLGSGLRGDVQTEARLAMQEVVEDLMRLFGSAGKA